MTEFATTFIVGLAFGSLAGSLITIFLVGLLHAAAPKSDEERVAEDDAQMRALRGDA